MNAINLNCLRCARLSSPASFRASSAVGFSTWSSPFYPSSFMKNPQRPLLAFAKKKNSESDAVLSPSIVEEVFMDDGEEDDAFLDGIFFFFSLGFYKTPIY